MGVEDASFHGFVNDGSLWNLFWCFLCIFYYRNSSILKILGQFENLGFVIMSTRENIRLIARAPWSKYTIWFKSYEHLNTTCQTHPWKSLGSALHTSVLTMLKCINKQNLIKIYWAVQELWAFLLKYLDWPKWCSTKPRHHFGQC